MPANLENSAMATGLENSHSNPKEGQCQIMFKLPHNCTHFTCWQGHAQNPSSWPSTVHGQECPDVQDGFRKGRGTRNQIANILWIIEKAREFEKNICFVDYTKAFDWIIINRGKLFKSWKYQTTLLAS